MRFPLCLHCFFGSVTGIMVRGLWFRDYGSGIVFLSFGMGKHNGLRL